MVSSQSLRRLAYFVEIVDAGSIRAAAGKLRLSSPVLSEALSDLEVELGTSLLTRTTRSMALTAAGEDVYEQAAAMLRHARQAMTQDSGTAYLTGRLAMTLPSELATGWLPSLLRDFKSLHEAVEIEVDVRDSQVDLKTSRFDLAVRARFSLERPGKTARSAIDVLPLDLIGAKQIVRQSSRSAERIDLPAPLLRAEGLSVSPKLPAIERRSGRTVTVHLQKGFSVSNRETARALAEQGFGAALLMRPGLEAGFRRGDLVRLLPGHDFGYVAVRLKMRDRYPSPAAKAFAELAASRGGWQAA